MFGSRKEKTNTRQMFGFENETSRIRQVMSERNFFVMEIDCFNYVLSRLMSISMILHWKCMFQVFFNFSKHIYMLGVCLCLLIDGYVMMFNFWGYFGFLWTFKIFDFLFEFLECLIFFRIFDIFGFWRIFDFFLDFWNMWFHGRHPNH